MKALAPSFEVGSQARWPNMLGIGPAKSGSTITADMLSWTGKVVLGSMECCRGETQFLVKEELFGKGLSRYRDFFEEITKEGVVAYYDKTPSYDTDFLVPFRALAFLGPKLKLIFTMRNPVDLDASQYFHFKVHQAKVLYSDWLRLRMRKYEELATCRSNAYGRLPRTKDPELRRLDEKETSLRDLYNASYYSVAEAGFVEDAIARQCPDAKEHVNMLGSQLYAANLRRWIRLFPSKDSLFCYSNEDLLRDRLDVKTRLFDFVGIDPKKFIAADKQFDPPDANRTLHRLAAATDDILAARQLETTSKNTDDIVDSILTSQQLLVDYLASHTSCSDVRRLEDICGYAPSYDSFKRCQLP